MAREFSPSRNKYLSIKFIYQTVKWHRLNIGQSNINSNNKSSTIVTIDSKVNDNKGKPCNRDQMIFIAVSCVEWNSSSWNRIPMSLSAGKSSRSVIQNVADLTVLNELSKYPWNASDWWRIYYQQGEPDGSSRHTVQQNEQQ